MKDDHRVISLQWWIILETFKERYQLWLG